MRFQPARSGNPAHVAAYKSRQKARGRVRLDVWVSAATLAKLRSLQTPFDKTLGRTVDRIVKARKSNAANFRESLRAALHVVLSGTD